jgi:hypothetical protein
MITHLPPTSVQPRTAQSAILPALVVTLSRGHLKAYEFDDSQNSGLRLVDEVEFFGPYDWHRPEAPGEERKAVIVSADPLAEPPTTESETDLGALRRIALAVGQLLRVHQPSSWWYAAPGDIHDLVLDLLDEPSRASITRQVRSDLTDVPSRKLKKHFTLARRQTRPRQP